MGCDRPLVDNFKAGVKVELNLVVEHHCSVHVAAFLFIIASSLHHVLWVTEQSQVHQLVIQTVLLGRQKLFIRIKTFADESFDELKDTRWSTVPYKVVWRYCRPGLLCKNGLLV